MSYNAKNFKNYRSRLIRFSSDDKTIDTQNNANFSVSLRTLGGPINNVLGVLVKYVSFPNIFDNVSSTTNILKIEDSNDAGNIKNVVIPAGWYNINTLIAELKTQIDAVLSVGSVAIQLVSDSNQRLQFTFTGVNASFYNSSPNLSTIGDVVGLSGDTGAFASVVVFQNIVNLMGMTDVYLHSRTIGIGNLSETDGTFSVCDAISVDKPYGSMVYMDFADADMHTIEYFPYESPRSFTTVDIKLRDVNGNILNIPSNYKMTVILKIFHL